MAQYYCDKCGRTMDETQFYTSNNLEKYPNNGKLRQCKKCLTLHVDNWDPATYKPILQEIDIPYVKDEWDKVLEKYRDNPEKMTGMTVLGRYISKMKLKQWKDKRWADTEQLEAEAEQKKILSMQAAGYSGEEIERQLAIDYTPIKPDMPEETGIEKEEKYILEEEPDEFVDQLTEEDKMYLRMKWGKGYRADEWIKMEQLYEDMMASYDIQGAGHKDTLIMICKTSLKANQLIDIGDVEGFQKMSKVYDSLMKSGKFTAAQNKGESGDFVDSVGELIELCEKEGYIERYYIESPNDKVDLTIADMQRYTRTLIEEETNLGEMIEKALRDNAREDEAEKENTELDIVDDIDLSLEDLEKSIKDQDFIDFEEFKNEQQEKDKEFLESDL